MQQLPQVLLEGERWYPASLWIWHLLLYPIQSHQGGKLIPVYQLPVVHHVIHHHSSEIPIWKIGMVCDISCPDCHTLFEGREQAVAHPIHLKIEEKRILMPNATSQVTRKIVKTKRSNTMRSTQNHYTHIYASNMDQFSRRLENRHEC